MLLPRSLHGILEAVIKIGATKGGVVMVFIQFIVKYDGIRRVEYFVGASKRDILDDTGDGKEFGGMEYSSFQIVAKEDVRLLNFPLFPAGVEAINKGTSKSFLIGSDGERVSL